MKLRGDHTPHQIHRGGNKWAKGGFSQGVRGGVPEEG